MPNNAYWTDRPLLRGLLMLTLLGPLGCSTDATEESSTDDAAKAGLQTSSSTPPAAEALEAASIIDQAVLEAPIAYLSSDALEGRGPASAGDQLTRDYLAKQLLELDLEPGFDGSWEQPFDVVGVTAKAPEQWRFDSPGGELELAWWDDYIATSGVQEPMASVEESEIVFVGYGIQAPEYDWDDLKGQDLSGKTLLMLNNDPDWDEALFDGSRRLYYGRWTYKYEIAAELGAAAAIIIHTTPSAGYPYQVVQSSWTGPQFQLPAEGEPRTQIEAWVSEEAARRLVALGGHDLDQLVESARSREFEPVPLGMTHSLALENTVERVETGNIAGLLRGSDDALSREVVVYTAHHDHLGIGQPDDSGDAIYNGALDNAAGVSQLLGIAKAFRALPQPPRRSVLFLFVAAEEQGLLGSAYWARHPSVLPGRITANINHDGGNIWGRTSDVTFIGYGKSNLDQVVERFATFQERSVVPDQFPDRGFFYRSDQFNLAKIGVPAIYLDNGSQFVGRAADWGKTQIEAWEENVYHQPSDEITDEWNYEGMIEDAQLSFFCGYELAQRDALAAWTPGDEFEAARTAALAEVED